MNILSFGCPDQCLLEFVSAGVVILSMWNADIVWRLEGVAFNALAEAVVKLQPQRHVQLQTHGLFIQPADDVKAAAGGVNVSAGLVAQRYWSVKAN